MNGWADAYTWAPPRLNRRERRAAARRERRGIGAWRTAVHREVDAAERAWLATDHRRRNGCRARTRATTRMVDAGHARRNLPPRDRRPLSEWMRANPWPSEVFHGG